MKKAFIYQWINKINNKKYIGSHIGVPEDGYTGSGTYFKNAYLKNPESFTRVILEVIESEDIHSEIRILEESYLNKVDAANSVEYYNITNRYYGGDVYSGLSTEDKAKMIKGWNEAGRLDRLNNPQKYIELIKKRSIAQRIVGKNVYQFSKGGYLLNEYDCLEVAADKTNTSKGNLHSALNESRNTAGGFRWSYSKKPNDLIPVKPRVYSKTGKQKNPSGHKIRIFTQVLQYDLENNLLRTWNSRNEIEEELGISKGMINHTLNSKVKKTGEYKGFIWKKGKQITIVEYNNKS